MRIANDELNLSGTAMAVGITSDPIWLGHIANYSLQIFFTGAPVGSFKLQLSDDLGYPNAAEEPNRDYGISHWTDITPSNQAILAAGDHGYNVTNAGYRWVRLVWTPTSGSGTITSARMNVKGI